MQKCTRIPFAAGIALVCLLSACSKSDLPPVPFDTSATTPSTTPDTAQLEPPQTSPPATATPSLSPEALPPLQSLTVPYTSSQINGYTFEANRVEVASTTTSDIITLNLTSILAVSAPNFSSNYTTTPSTGNLVFSAVSETASTANYSAVLTQNDFKVNTLFVSRISVSSDTTGRSTLDLEFPRLTNLSYRAYAASNPSRIVVEVSNQPVA